MTGARLVQRKGRVDWVQTCATPVQRKGGLIAVKSRISGKEAVYVARESERRRPVKLLVSRSVHASTINAWRRPEKGGRRGTQGNGGWEADRDGMKGGRGRPRRK